MIVWVALPPTDPPADPPADPEDTVLDGVMGKLAAHSMYEVNTMSK